MTDINSSSNSQSDYPIKEINKIIDDAKKNNEFLNYLNDNKQYLADEEQSKNSKINESVESDESSISDKYLNSNYDHSK